MPDIESKQGKNIVHEKKDDMMAHTVEHKPASPTSNNANANLPQKKKKIGPPSGPAPKSAVANYRAKAALPPPSTPPPKQHRSSAAMEWRKANSVQAPPADKTTPTVVQKAEAKVPTNQTFETKGDKKFEQKPTTGISKVQRTTDVHAGFDLFADEIDAPTYSKTKTWDFSDNKATAEDNRKNRALLEDGENVGEAGKTRRGRAVPISGTRYATKEDDIVIIKAQMKTKPTREPEAKKAPTKRSKKKKPKPEKENNEDKQGKDHPILHEITVEDVEDDIPDLEQLLDDSDSSVVESEEEISILEEESKCGDPTIEIEGTKEDPIRRSSKEIQVEAKGDADDTLAEVRLLEEQGKQDIIMKGSDDEIGKPKERNNSGDISLDEGQRTKTTKKSAKQGKKCQSKGNKKAQTFNPRSVPYVPHDLKNFVTVAPKEGSGCIIRCFLERTKAGTGNLAPTYTFLLEINNSSGRPIIYAKKKPTGRLTSHYVISLDKEDLSKPRHQRSFQYLGKLRTQTGFTEYTLYDEGDSPEAFIYDSDTEEKASAGSGDLRRELAVISFTKSKKAFARKMHVAIPSVNGSRDYCTWQPLRPKDSLAMHFSDIREDGSQNIVEHDRIICLHKRETKYDPLSSCIVDFKSRATCVSVKNFQLIHSRPTDTKLEKDYEKINAEHVFQDEGTSSVPVEHVILQMGKVGRDCFNVDFQYPLSMLQAFAICLSRFDTKQR